VLFVDIMAIVVHLDTIHRTMWGTFRKIVIMDARYILLIYYRYDVKSISTNLFFTKLMSQGGLYIPLKFGVIY
jgi:hypothetical protein